MSTGEIVIVLAAAVAAALVKTVVGMGYPLVLIPVLALFLDIDEAITIVSISNLALNVTLLRSTRVDHDSSVPLGVFVVAGAVGAMVGAGLLTRLDQDLLRWALVIMIVAFVGSRIRSTTEGLPRPHMAAVRRSAAPVGLLAGFFQGAAGISGPIVSPYFLWTGLRKEPYVFAIAVVFGVTGASQIIVLIIDGAFNSLRLFLGLGLVAIAQAVVPFGDRLRRRLDAERFEQLVLALLVVAAISLVIRNL